MTDKKTTAEFSSKLAGAILDAMEFNLPRGITRAQLQDVIDLHVGGMGRDRGMQDTGTYMPPTPPQFEAASSMTCVVTDDDVATLSAPGVLPVYCLRGDTEWRPVDSTMTFRWEHNAGFNEPVPPGTAIIQADGHRVTDSSMDLGRSYLTDEDYAWWAIDEDVAEYDADDVICTLTDMVDAADDKIRELQMIIDTARPDKAAAKFEMEHNIDWAKAVERERQLKDKVNALEEQLRKEADKAINPPVASPPLYGSYLYTSTLGIPGLYGGPAGGGMTTTNTAPEYPEHPVGYEGAMSSYDPIINGIVLTKEGMARIYCSNGESKWRHFGGPYAGSEYPGF